jgi:outer membrane immunogenic protein
MKRLIIVAAAAVAFAGTAQAADLYVKAPPIMAYDWSGIYVGANGGGGWADYTWSFPSAGVLLPVKPKGALAGGQIGINRQIGNWVWGAEVTGDWASLKSHEVAPVNVDVNTKLHDLETLTGRLGYAFNNVLVYGKAGGATGVLGASFSTGGVFVNAQSQRVYGGTVGAGLEYGLTPNWIIGVEYDFTRLFPGQYQAPPVVPFGAASAFEVQSVVGRVSYKF